MVKSAHNGRKRGVVRSLPGSDNEEIDSNPKRMQHMRYDENQGNEAGKNDSPNTNGNSNMTNNDQDPEGGLIIMELVEKSRDGKLIQDRESLKYMLKKALLGQNTRVDQYLMSSHNQ